MKNFDWDKIIAAYKNGLAAEMLQAQIKDEWGVIWTIPPCSPDAAERVGRQFSRSRAQALRHIRRAILRRAGRSDQAVVIATELPAQRQQVRDLESGAEIILRHFLRDDALSALEESFMPQIAKAV